MARHWAARLKCIFEKKSPPHPPLSNKPAGIYEVVFFSKKPWHPKASPLEIVAFFFLFFCPFFFLFSFGFMGDARSAAGCTLFYLNKGIKIKNAKSKIK